MSNRVIYAIYNDDDILMDGWKLGKAHKYVEEVFTPFEFVDWTNHGIIMTRLAIWCVYGCIGITFGTVMMNYIMIQDWPQDIGENQV
jgi:hypothetical protein